MKRKTKRRGASLPRPPALTPERLRWLNDQLAQLAVGCPWSNSNPAECPLCNVRKLPAADIAKWLERLSQGDKEYLVLYHQCCLAVKSEDEVTRNR